MLQLEDVSYQYHVSKRRLTSGAGLRALNKVNLRIESGETLGVIGETGSGKSTIGMITVGQLQPLSGRVLLGGKELSESWSPGKVQMVFQDPVSSLSPRMTIEQILTEPLAAQAWGTDKERRFRAAELIERVGLTTDHLARRRSEFSGGQCQRIAIARAIITKPQLIVLDEPTSSLDVIVQAKILRLLEDIRAEYQTSYMFISHNLAVVEAVSDRVVVLYRGHIVEEGIASDVLAEPRHPYTKSLARAVLSLDGSRQEGDDEDVSSVLGSRTVPIQGCPYQQLCPLKEKVCEMDAPQLVREGNRAVACHVLNSVGAVPH